MRYFYENRKIRTSMYGQTYFCDHPVYDACTLYMIGSKGLAVIQQYHKEKHTYWSEIHEGLTDQIYLHPRFKAYFDTRAGEAVNGLYPTVSVRQIMWALRMKPLPRKRWETVFDRREI